MAEDALLALHLPLHYYYYDCLGFPFMCLHLLKHALYILWMDFHPCLYIYTGLSFGMSPKEVLDDIRNSFGKE